MAYTRKQVVTCISIIYIIFSTALSGYASSRLNRLSIPVSSSLSGFTTALPIIAGLLLEGSYDLTRRQERRHRLPRGATTRPPLVIVANTIIFIYSTVVITLLGTHAAPPSGLNCGLEGRWRELFKQKDSEAIRTIQDAFKCCGLLNPHDQAWPFPDKTHNAHACEEAFGRTNGCLNAWKGEEQRVAGILMAVVGLVFVWQFAIIIVSTRQTSWLRRILPGRFSPMIADEEHGSPNGQRRAIQHLPDFNRYSDNAVAEVDDSEEEGEPQRAIEASDRDVEPIRKAVAGSGNAEEPLHSATQNEWARQ
ncbi:uncharacterized protein BDR25DRAFT_261987 [Lindgomyces ingoldianus]|uniref:Uncharacterized protein n=1 Tax=Lindgomyces ingoldianus TaxID=673940 RepID=A0ACB6QUX7_9PLEO|nr:uncharacterized protein BDR25DRAFT_261987 [Lindgomyces ingoldianus]KAF2470804.1 hypothetical protein BDR25DRAFT_261987 [Lindgomyces ingoldianus]